MKRLRALSRSFLISSAIALFGSAAAARDLVDTADDRQEFTTLIALIKAAGLEEEVRRSPMTMFAPTDAAFAKLPAEALERLREDRVALREMLGQHLVPGVIFTSETRSGDFNTRAGRPLSVQVDAKGLVRVNEAAVVAADLEASNGVLHAIDAVMLPGPA